MTTYVYAGDYIEAVLNHFLRGAEPRWVMDLFATLKDAGDSADGVAADAATCGAVLAFLAIQPDADRAMELQGVLMVYSTAGTADRVLQYLRGRGGFVPFPNLLPQPEESDGD